MTPIKTIPHSDEGERSLLGSVLRNPDVIDSVIDAIPDESAFYNSRHRVIFDAMVALYRQGRACDISTVCDQLQQMAALDAVGGRVGIVELADGVAASANVQTYADIVRDRWLSRRIIAAAEKIIHDCHSGKNVSDVLNRADSDLFDVRNRSGGTPTVRIGDVIDETMERIDGYQSGRVQPTLTYTGFADIDRILEIAPGQLVVIGGATSQGKTQLGLQIAEHNAIERERPTVIFSLEMDPVALTIRTLASIGRMDKGAFKRKDGLSQDDLLKLERVSSKISDKPLYIADVPRLTPSELRANLRQMIARHGIQLVVVDYLQLMTADGKTKDSSEYRELSEITRMLKMIAKELSVPIILLSQLSRTHQHERRLPGTRDLRGSGSIEQDADAILFVYRGKVGRDDAPTERIMIAKQRDGQTGHVDMVFTADGRWEMKAREVV